MKMKIRFKRFEPTSTFLKLFGVGRDKADSGASSHEERDDVYEYYYKRSSTYYFRNDAGDKFSIDYKEPPNELVRGNRYKIEDINKHNS